LVALLLLASVGLADEGWITHSVALSPDLKTCVRGSMHAERGTGLLRIEDARTGVIRFEQRGFGVIRAFAFSPDGKRFVASSDHGPLKIIDAASGKVVGQVAGHKGWVHTVAMGGRCVASAGADDVLRVWDTDRNAELWRKADVRVGAVALSLDGTRLASTDQFGAAHIWDAATGKELRTLDTGDGRWGFVVAFSRDGKRVAAGNRRVAVFETESGKLLARLDLHATERATALAFSADGSRLATACRDRSVRVWSLEDGSSERMWTLKGGVGALAFSRDGRTLGAAKHYGKCHFWDMAFGDEIARDETRRARPAWKVHTTGVDTMLLSVGFFDGSRGLAVGGTQEKAPSVILVTPDDGQSWSACEIDARGRLYDIDVVDRESAFAVGFDGMILRTRDRGVHWDKLKTPAPHWLAAVDFVSPTTGYVVGGAGPRPVVWKTTDGGDAWVSLADKLPERARKESLRDVQFTSVKRGFAVGTGGLIVETTDGGASWVARDSGTDVWLRAISVLGKTIHVAGKGVLLRSIDDGKTWASVPIPPKKKLNGVVFVSAQIGWITNFDGEVLETLDGGKTWSAVQKHGDVTIALDVSPEHIIATTGDGKILRRRR
jgi:photosystem II stability/assembly factor-like uncharacterized protein